MSEGGGVSEKESRSSEVRIGDAERESALRALGEHLSAGRLDVDEYGDRSAKVTAARTGRDLSELFADLPAPHPDFGSTSAPPADTSQPAGQPPVTATSNAPARIYPPGGTPAQRVAAGVMGAAWIGGIAAVAATHLGWLIFIPIALSIVFGSVWGRGWRHDLRREQEEARAEYRERRAEEHNCRHEERRQRYEERRRRHDR